MADVLVVMGVSGSGKTTVGRLLADRLGWEFADADAFHGDENIAKMAAGIPLDDRDRLPWLQTLRALILDRLETGRSLVLACSALKQAYRDLLSGDDRRVSFIYLKGSQALIRSRLQARAGHYMLANLLESQFQALEEPADALVLDVGRSPEQLADQALRRLRTEGTATDEGRSGPAESFEGGEP
jgi:gluconokinase